MNLPSRARLTQLLRKELLQLLRERAHPAEIAIVLPDSVADIGKWLFSDRKGPSRILCKVIHVCQLSGYRVWM